MAALWLWRRRRSRAALWAAAAFAVLAVVVDVSRVLPEDPGYLPQRLLVGLLVLFPYLLYRFASTFEPGGRRVELLVSALTGGVLVWTFALPEIPGEGEARSTGFQVYVSAFVVHWTALTAVTAARLWRAGRGQPTVASNRMRLLAVAAGSITLALLLAAQGADDSSWRLAIQLLVTVSAVAFLLGLTPPAILRIAWRRPEEARLREAIAGLMGAESEDQVAERVLPAMADIVGARAVGLADSTGELAAVYGAAPGQLASARERGEVVEVEIDGRRLLVWATAYAPFFGDEELGLLESLGVLTALALDRARLHAGERATREALERADEVKTQFVALAAHELRAPVATLRGFADTIEARRDDLDREQLDRLETTLFAQIRRLSALVEQLLDLSRLDAEAIDVQPRPVEVKSRLEEVVRTTAGQRSEEVVVQADDDLHAIVDPTVLERVVANLVVNALSYGETPVRVSAVQTDRHFRVVVEDGGPGVPPEFVPQLFERFTRGAAGKRPGGGSGLGLAIARSYAQAHGGQLLYRPGEPRGARFELVVPAERRPDPGQPPSSP
ncbi:MAG TPA: HAMP domain-containing sensor histidine kinase [Gaiellaceae bacterium]|nr:HAMP domain-containing sensor histidine kinase [Gaiellaceae bacterium]